MITVFGNWGTDNTSAPCEEGTFDGGRFGGSAQFTLCNGNSSSVNLNPQTASKILCIQSGSINNSTLVWNSTGPCEVEGGGNPPPLYNAFTVERTSDGFSDYVQYDSNVAVNDVVLISSNSGCFEIMSETNVFDPSIYGVITGECLN